MTDEGQLRWANDLNKQAADEWEKLYRRALQERNEARQVARELWGWVQRVEPDGVDHPGNWEGPYPWLKETEIG